MADKTLPQKLKRITRLYLSYLRVFLQKRMAYRASFFVHFIVVVITGFIPIFFVNFLFQSIPTLAGWNQDDALLVVASYLIVDGAAWLFFIAGMWQFDVFLRDGTFDTLLLKPASPLLQLIFRNTNLEELGSAFIGIIIVIRYFLHHSIPHPVLAAIAYIVLIAVGVILYACIFLIFKSISFKKIETWGVSIFAESLIGFSRYPKDIFSQSVLRAVIHTVVPIAFIGSVPADLLRGGTSFLSVLYGVLVAGVFVVVARLVWRRTIRHYSSASS